MKTVHIIVTGRVQGVGFRYFTIRYANDIGLHGWVRNMPDDRVETVLQGPDRDIERMIELLQKGPGTSIVTELKIREVESEEFSGFNVRF